MQALLPSCVWRTEPAGGTRALFFFDFNSETVLHLSGFLRFDILPKTGLFVSPVTSTSPWRKFLMALASTFIGTIWSCVADLEMGSVLYPQVRCCCEIGPREG